MKKKKLQIILSIFFVLSLLTPQSTLAFGNLLQTSHSANKNKSVNIQDELQKTKEETQQALDNYRNALGEKKVEMLKKYGLKLIDRRLQDLSKAQEIVAETVRLSEENRAEIQNNLETCSNGLTALRSDIENANDVDTLKTLIENIFYDYRVYLVELPKDHGLRSAGLGEYVLNEHESRVITRIEVTIEEYKAAGKDTTTAETLLSNLQAKFDEIQGYLDSAQSNFRAMKPAEDTTEAEAYSEAGKADLTKAEQGVTEAKDIIKDIIAELKALKDE